MPSFAAPCPVSTTVPTESRRRQLRNPCLPQKLKTASSPSTPANPSIYGDLPSTREAVVVDRRSPFRGPRVGETAVLAPQSGEVLIEVYAAGVNAMDWFNTDLFATMPPLLRQSAFVPGKDVSGVVVAVGPDVDMLMEGDEVFGLTGYVIQRGFDGMTPRELASGSFSTFTTVKAANCVRKPPNVSFIDAAGVPLAGLLAWQALIDVAELPRGSNVLILGGAGGVGTLAIQIAKTVCKCETVAVTCSPSSAPLVKALGADVVIDHNTQYFEQALAGARYDCVVDAVGYDDKCRRSSQVLRRSGILVDIAGPPRMSHLRKGQETESLFEYYKGVYGDGKRVRHQSISVKYDAETLGDLADYMQIGRIMPVTDKVYYGLDKFQEAFEFNKRGAAHGKVIINVKDPMEE